jgi:hypothetical protein
MKKKLDQWQIFVTNTAEAGGGRKGSLIGRALLILVFYV